MTFTDDLGNQLIFDKRPKKIISLVPSITETLYDLNLEEFILGITKSCIHPAHFKHNKEIVRDAETFYLEKIKTLQPDIIFCNKEESTSEIIKQLQKITNIYIIDITSIDDSKRMISNLGLLLNRRTEADLLNRKIELKLSDFKIFIKEFDTKKVAYFINYKPWRVAANNTFINNLLSLCKLENSYVNLDQYPVINPQRIRHDGDPEILLFSLENFPFEDKHAFEISEYTNRSSAVFIDGEMFSWFGSRILKAFDYFKTVRNRLDQGASF